MLFESRCILTILALLLWALPISANADKTSFNQAVNEYLKGFRACSEANKLRTSDTKKAIGKFDFYLQQLDKASAIDESILTSSERNMDTNLAYCKQVDNNLKRAEATPILQHGFGYCEQSEVAYKKQEYNKARESFELYRRFKEQAYAITSTLDEVFILSSKVKACQRLENKLNQKLAAENKQENQLQQVVKSMAAFKKQCERVSAVVSKKSFGVSQLGKANKMLQEAVATKPASDQVKAIKPFMESHPDTPSVQAAQTLLSENNDCEQRVTDKLRKVTKQQSDQASKIVAQNKLLQSSFEHCQSAQQAVSEASLDKAVKLYKRSSATKSQATNKAALKLVKANPDWKVVGDFNRWLDKTKTCHVQVSQAINVLKREQKAEQQAAAKRQAKVKARQRAEAEQRAKRQAEALRRKQQQEQAAREAQRREAAAAAKAKAVVVEKKPKPTVKPDTDVDDWDDDDLFVDDEFKIKSKKEKSKHRSWTDIIR